MRAQGNKCGHRTKNMCMNERRAVRTGAGWYERVQVVRLSMGGVRTSVGGYKHSRGSSRGYVPLVSLPLPPIFLSFSLLFNFFFIFYIHVFTIF